MKQYTSQVLIVGTGAAAVLAQAGVDTIMLEQGRALGVVNAELQTHDLPNLYYGRIGHPQCVGQIMGL